MKKSIKETVKDAIMPTVDELGYRIWDVTYSKVGADYHLEVTIDNDEGITIEDCERVHRAIDPILDECDPIEDSYYLDVSSPGVERDLRTEEHLLWAVGEKVSAKLFAPYQGMKTIVGTLLSYEDGNLTIENDSGEYTLPQNAISKINNVFFED